MVDRLKEQPDSVDGSGASPLLSADEKRRRVYYQDIVYAICNSIDGVFPGSVVCGTADDPSDEVQKRADQMRRALKAARHVVDMVDQHGGPWPTFPELHEAVESLREALGRYACDNPATDHEKDTDE